MSGTIIVRRARASGQLIFPMDGRMEASVAGPAQTDIGLNTELRVYLLFVT